MKGQASAGDKKNKIFPIKISKRNGHTISDVYGDKKFKQGLEDICLSIINKNLYHVFGIEPPKSFLFYGPPGTGKTYSVNAIANTLSQMTPKDVYMLSYNVGELGTAYINMGAVNIQEFFNVGFQLAMDRETGYVLYWFDEADSIMKPRGRINATSEDDKLLNTLMTNLQDLNDRGTDEYIFFATNFKDGLDDASIRSGRIGKKLEFKLPNFESRKSLIKGIIDSRNERVGYKMIRKYDVNDLARKTDGLNNADLVLMIDNAINNKLTYELRRKVVENKVIPAYCITQKWINESLETILQEKEFRSRKIGFI